MCVCVCVLLLIFFVEREKQPVVCLCICFNFILSLLHHLHTRELICAWASFCFRLGTIASGKQPRVFCVVSESNRRCSAFYSFYQKRSIRCFVSEILTV